MTDYQALIFRWAESQPPAAGFVLFLFGVCLTLQGFRFARYLIPMAAGAIALAVATAFFDVVVGFAIAVLIATCGAAWPRFGLLVGSVITFAALAFYLAMQVGLPPTGTMAMGGVGALAGAVAPRFYPRTLPLIISSLHGGALIVLGLISFGDSYMPGMISTFVVWSNRNAFMAPAALLLLVVMGMSVQLKGRQGDIETGGSGGAGQ